MIGKNGVRYPTDEIDALKKGERLEFLVNNNEFFEILVFHYNDARYNPNDPIPTIDTASDIAGPLKITIERT